MALRDRLRSRQLPQATVGIRVDWSEESYETLREAEAAEQRLRLTPGDSPHLDEVKEKAIEARARADAFFEALTVRALPAAEFEELMNAHQPTAEHRELGYGFDRDSFVPALLSACVEGPETPEDWSEMIRSGELVSGEVNTLFGVAMQMNDRAPSVSLGKGLTTTSS